MDTEDIYKFNSLIDTLNLPLINKLVVPKSTIDLPNPPK